MGGPGNSEPTPGNRKTSGSKSEPVDNFPGREHMKAIETRRMRGQGGFTLIELLVVIAILAVLAGVVVFAVNGINNNSQDTACKTEARTVKTAVQAYFAENQAYGTKAQLTNSADGFLDGAPDGVAIADPATPTTKNVLTWTGKCAGQPGQP